MATLPHIPFAQLPRRQYKKGPVSIGGEPKPRMDLDKFFNGEDVEEYNESDFGDDSDTSSEEGYDLMAHIANLLPGELEDGKRPQKQADVTHLQDLKYVRKRPDRLKYIKNAYNWVMTLRARERERRKHYILREYEKRIQDFDNLQKKVRDDAMAEEERLIKKEAKERQQRIERNSRKKKDKLQMTKDFDDKLAQRLKEERRINFYCNQLPEWAIEGIYKKFAKQEAEKQAAIAAKEEADFQQREADKRAVIARDQAVLADDKQLTDQIEHMMLQYGMLHYDKPLFELEDEKIDHIFAQHRLETSDDESIKRKKQMRKLARAERAARRVKKNQQSVLPSLTANNASSRPGTSTQSGRATPSRPSTASSHISGVGETTLDLEVAPNADFDALKRELHRTRFGGGKGKGKKGNQAVHRQVEEIVPPFPDIDFQDTGDIRVVYGHHLKTLGALAFASELAQGACPFLEEFRFQACDIRDPGFLRLIQGVRLGNLTSLKVLDLRGNHLSALSIDYFRDICTYGIFNNLEEMLLGNNELGDAGVEAIIRVMLLGYFRSLYALHLQRNSITDKGFRALVTMIGNIHERYCPNLDALRLELNLVSPACKQAMSPLPSFVSV